jgi:hypothetical protein
VGRNAVHRTALQPGGAAQTRRRRQGAAIAPARRAAVALLAGLALALAWAERPAAHDPITTSITFAREIRAILEARCTICHAPGGTAPMPLTTYQEVRPWARAIKQQVLERRMPVWHAARGFGAFKNDPTPTPAEVAMIVSWVDGGLPAGKAAVAASRPAVAARGEVAVIVPAGWVNGSAPAAASWVSGWSFDPGDALISSAVISSGQGTLATWVAGDATVELPADSAIRVTSPLHVTVQRRAPADFERRSKRRGSVLRLITQSTAPQRRVWTERAACGTPRTGRGADLLAVRPLLAQGGSARIWIERAGAPRTIVGWFRDFQAEYARTYWLARAAELPLEARLQADVPCAVELTLASR